MAKIKYHFNIHSLKIEKVRITLRERLVKLLGVLASGMVFSAVVLFFAYNFFNSPKEKMQLREIEQYKLQYEILNDRMGRIQKVLNDLQDRDDNIYRVIFEAEPIPASMRKAGIGGADRYAKLAGYKNSDIIINTTQKLDQIAGQMYVQSKSFDEVFKLAKGKEKMLAAIPAIQPVSNKNLRALSSFFGYRTDPFYKVLKFHEGIDFSAPSGTKIYATGDGIVINAGRASGYGNQIIINHGFNYNTMYAHLSRMNVHRGQMVKRGQVIGFVGNTGKSTSPHLHYEVLKFGKPIDPINFFFNDLTPAEYQQMLELSSRPSQTMD